MGSPPDRVARDACGCTDNRCIGYHHDEHEECGCLPALINLRAETREGYPIWQDYRAAADANDGQDDPEAVEAARARAEAWVRHHFPNVETFALDAVVKGRRGISGTYPLRPGQCVPEGRHRTPPATASCCGVRAPARTATSRRDSTAVV